jgi:hypothetical protein
MWGGKERRTPVVDMPKSGCWPRHDITPSFSPIFRRPYQSNHASIATCRFNIPKNTGILFRNQSDRGREIGAPSRDPLRGGKSAALLHDPQFERLWVAWAV